MKKILTIVAALMMTTAIVNAQDAGALKVNLGYAPVGGVIGEVNGSDNITNVNPISLSADYGLMKIGQGTLTIGAYASMEFLNYDVPALNSTYRGSNYTLAARIGYNYQVMSNLGVHCGLLLGSAFPYAYMKAPIIGETSGWGDTQFAWAPYVGADFYVFGNLGVFADLGFGNIAKTTNDSNEAVNTVFINLGLTYRF